MSPRTGRPTDDPKKNRMEVRLSEAEVERLEYCSRMTGKSKGEIIRIGIDTIYNQLKETETQEKD
jgi:predicted DNA-binding protein